MVHIYSGLRCCVVVVPLFPPNYMCSTRSMHFLFPSPDCGNVLGTCFRVLAFLPMAIAQPTILYCPCKSHSFYFPTHLLPATPLKNN